mmetsp:Transcript_36607/g.42544  ORF Transcript_36607/g.42544 Transcript_36607/m.42544 type:complete len:204 (+) Transcript_36607:134-745(+)
MSFRLRLFFVSFITLSRKLLLTLRFFFLSFSCCEIYISVISFFRHIIAFFFKFCSCVVVPFGLPPFFLDSISPIGDGSVEFGIWTRIDAASVSDIDGETIWYWGSTSDISSVLVGASSEITEVLFTCLCFLYAFSIMLRVRDGHAVWNWESISLWKPFGTLSLLEFVCLATSAKRQIEDKIPVLTIFSLSSNFRCTIFLCDIS